MKRRGVMRKWMLSLVPLLFSLGAMAQEGETARVIPELTPTKIRIGEQARLRVNVVAPKESPVNLLLPADTLVTAVEILGVLPGDTTEISDRLQQIVYDVVITSFDSATYHLEHIGAEVAGQYVPSSEVPILMVGTVPVDLEHPDQIHDHKAQWAPDFVLWDYLVYVAWFVVLLTLIGLVYLLVMVLRAHRRRRIGKEEAPAPPPLRDPYDEAMERLQLLKEERLWESRGAKEYYTELTDILRRYLRRVYGFETGEKTSGEILELFRTHIGRERMYEDLSRILTTADLAKFARYEPEPGESIGLLSASRAFVEEHKPHPVEEEEEKTSEEKATKS